ncbi:hypothetical protein ACP70R_002764 [Stipagrostis hirtigluma subsp. patula]
MEPSIRPTPPPGIQNEQDDEYILNPSVPNSPNALYHNA